MRRHYSIFDKQKIAGAVVLAVILVAIGFLIGTMCHGEQLATCWAMCKPGSYISIRETPRKTGTEIGYLDCGDSFQTDGESVDGWIRCYGAGDHAGWVYCGYVVTEEPKKIGQRYVCCANRRVACRKWMGGPQIDSRPWMNNGQTCEVFCMADGWAVTSRGYIKSEWLEADPE